MTAETITTTGGGWHEARLTCRDAARGGWRVWHLRWRTQRHECHDQTWGVADGEHSPAVGATSYGAPEHRVSQCGNCGSVRVFDFSERRVV